jgi:DHA1 family bicyclomycin/chloramphenicol resistance-like MFS transporter
MKLLSFTETQFGWIYGANVFGLIIASQINRIWLKRRSSAEVLFIANAAQVCVGLSLVAGCYFGVIGTMATVALIFCYLFCFGFVSPNVIALALQPFTRNAGSASALIGSIQMITAATASGLVSYLDNGTALPMLSLMAVCAGICLALLRGGYGSSTRTG